MSKTAQHFGTSTKDLFWEQYLLQIFVGTHFCFDALAFVSNTRCAGTVQQHPFPTRGWCMRHQVIPKKKTRKKEKRTTRLKSFNRGRKFEGTESAAATEMCQFMERISTVSIRRILHVELQFHPIGEARCFWFVLFCLLFLHISWKSVWQRCCMAVGSPPIANSRPKHQFPSIVLVSFVCVIIMFHERWEPWCQDSSEQRVSCSMRCWHQRVNFRERRRTRFDSESTKEAGHRGLELLCSKFNGPLDLLVSIFKGTPSCGMESTTSSSSRRIVSSSNRSGGREGEGFGLRVRVRVRAGRIKG